MSVADPKIIDPVARIQLRGQPARLLTAASPSLEWSRRILEFRKNLRMGDSVTRLRWDWIRCATPTSGHMSKFGNDAVYLLFVAGPCGQF